MDNPCIAGIIFLALMVGAIDLGWCVLRKYIWRLTGKKRKEENKDQMSVALGSCRTPVGRT